MLSTSDAILRRWREAPPLFVRECLGATPDRWQDQALAAFPKAPRLALKASKGPGKTAVEAWLAWNFLLTRPHPKIAATSITGDNLTDCLWSELAKWQARSEILQAAFEWQKTRIVSRDHPETWWMSARTWSRNSDAQQQANTLGGLHADHLLFILDESGSIPNAVMVAAEASLATGVECHIVQAGNTTDIDGPLGRACTSERRLWVVIEVSGDPDDPDRSPRVSLEWAREQIEKYGRDNPWVLVNVFGQFPKHALNALIGPDEMSAAFRRSYPEDAVARSPRVLGIDVSRFGDDSSVIFPRQGLQAFAPQQYRNIDGTQGAGAAAFKWREWGAAVAFVDDTGGFGSSWIDNMRVLGYRPIGVQFAGRANDPRYYNKRAEMYFELVNWIKGGGALPRCPELTAALTQTTYSFRGDRLLLEEKAQVKERIGFSPDHADALALTFAQPVASPSVRRAQALPRRSVPPGGEALSWMGV